MTRFLRSEVENALATPGSDIEALATEWRSFFFPMADDAQFADAYAERFRGDGRGNEVPSGTARNTKAISSDPARYPENYSYVPEEKAIKVGDGVFRPVEQAVWDLEASGLKIVQSWLGYRMKKRAGKKSSPLDEIRPDAWTPRMTDELLELLWVLEATLAMEPLISDALDKTVTGPCFAAADLPTPTPLERKPPKAVGEDGDQLSMFGADDEDDNEQAELG